MTIFIAEGDGGRGLKKCFLWCSIITVYATFKEKEVAHLVLIIYLVLIVLFRRIHISTHTHTLICVILSSFDMMLCKYLSSRSC